MRRARCARLRAARSCLIIRRVRFAFFVHSLASDWNHGNAHFVRGVVSELIRRGHEVRAFAQKDNWSRWNLERDHGPAAAEAYLEAYPSLAGVEREYELAATASFADPDATDVDAAAEALDLPRALAGVDAVIVHEWTPPAVVAAVGRFRRERGGPPVLFHDTHHRMASEPEKMARFDLSGYDGVLAFGQVLTDLYEQRGWRGRAWTWHEAADPHVFRPLSAEKHEDLVWVGNWGDDERTAELHEFLLGPIRALDLRATVHGVRYPDDAKEALAAAGVAYGGYLPNHLAPAAFARRRVTVHVPRRYYVTHLPGIPTIRVFEALACGVPLVCSPWHDAENLFTPGQDYLAAATGGETTAHLRRLLADDDYARSLAAHGRATVLARHTCAHRADELLTILDRLA